MKRILICASAAIVALASCSETHVVYNEAPTEIGFKVLDAAMTKATALHETHETMGVFANYTNDHAEYFPNVQFEYHDDATPAHWGGTVTQYYPMTGNLNFACYAPYDQNAWSLEYSDDGKATLKGTGLTSLDKTDLLYGKTLSVDNEKSSDLVDVTLSHALAEIVINVKANEANLITFNSITVKSVSADGTFTAVYDAASGTLESAEWVAGTPKDHQMTSTAYLTTESSEYGRFFIVPGSQTRLTIDYTIKDYLKNKTVDIGLDDTNAAEWERGKRYIYNLSASVYAIRLNPSVEDMEEVKQISSQDGSEIWTEIN